MKSQKNILIAFLLNLCFSAFEFFGGIITGSVAVMSDALHDLGDAASIGVSYFLERKSTKDADDSYTFGYGRYSILGAAVTTFILICGSVTVLYKAILRIFEPREVDYNGMIIFAVIGVAVNLLAAFATRKGEGANQRAVNLHMLEDVAGWFAVLVGAVVMHFTSFYAIDSLISVITSLFIIIGAVKNLKGAVGIFLEKVPDDISVKELKKHLCEIQGVADVHHIHVWSVNEENVCITLHVVSDESAAEIKGKVRTELEHFGIYHCTVEIESTKEKCEEIKCTPKKTCAHSHHHHH